MEDLTITRGETFLVRVKNADNELIIRLNGNTVYQKGQHGDPTMNDEVNLTDRLALGCNNLVLELSNWPHRTANPWHIRYEISAAGSKLPVVDVRSPSNGPDPVGGIRWRDEMTIHVTP